mmetsp:Transcript_16090/g.52405  ORF Transcript_16090/g.52405 Transcript_16090/m.52405 type:complete len:154 (-) Transcript_16090:181-642(-)
MCCRCLRSHSPASACIRWAYTCAQPPHAPAAWWWLPPPEWWRGWDSPCTASKLPPPPGGREEASPPPPGVCCCGWASRRPAPHAPPLPPEAELSFELQCEAASDEPPFTPPAARPFTPPVGPPFTPPFTLAPLALGAEELEHEGGREGQVSAE